MSDANPPEWEQRPNGCPDDEHWKECYRNGWIKKGTFCKHPGEAYVDNDGIPICCHNPNAVKLKDYLKRKENL